jgi:hypothetical protein
MRVGGKHLVLSIVVCTSALLQAETYHGIDFSCTIIPQANLLGVTMASNVHTTATNVSSEKVFFRYRVTVTGSRGTVRVFGSGEQSLLGQGNFAPTAIDAHTFESLFSRAGVQDEFPKTCQFSRIQVCPATPPAGFPKGNYYRPFLDGKCSEIGETNVVVFPDTGANLCSFASQAQAGEAQMGTQAAQSYSQYGDHYGVSWSHGKKTLDDAKSEAYAGLEAEGFKPVVANTPGNSYDFVGAATVLSDCTHPHGAIAAVVRTHSNVDPGSPADPDGIWAAVAGAGADNIENAGQMAVAKCQSIVANPHYFTSTPQNGCHVIASW